MNSNSGFLTPDAGPDTSRADYSPTDEPTALNEPHPNHDDKNVDVPVSEATDTGADKNVVDRQIGIIGRTSG